MKERFTPGEWEVTKCGHNVSVWSDNESITEPTLFLYPCEEHSKTIMANAHLIAAAPDMYRMLDILSNFNCPVEYMSNDEVEAFDKIESLLAKARGEDV